MILAIDPGPTESAYVVYCHEDRTLDDFGKIPTRMILDVVAMHRRTTDTLIACEWIACYGMSVGAEVFDTCLTVGRIVQVCDPKPIQLGKRLEVKMALCHSARANDSNIRQALIDWHGGKERAIGKKATPGPLYGVSGDVWAALGVAVTVGLAQPPANRRSGSRK